MDTKRCICCKQEKPIEEFKFKNKRLGERTNLCKQCSNERNLKYQKKKKKDTKEVKLSFTQEQAQVLLEKAREVNTTTGRYIKRLALEKPITETKIVYKDIERYNEIKTMLSMFTNQVKRIGNNVNQIAYHMNIGDNINVKSMDLNSYLKFVVEKLDQLEELMQEGIV